MPDGVNDHLLSVNSPTATNSANLPSGALSSTFNNVFLLPETETKLTAGNKAFVIVEYKTTSSIPPRITRANMPLLANIVQESKAPFMAELDSETSVEIRREMKYSPQISLIADRADLEKLAAMSNVVAIKENRLAAPVLNNSFFRVGADVAHDMGMTGAGHSIAVLDSGTDPNHTMFSGGRVVASTCFNTSIADLTPFGFDGFIASSCPNGMDDQISLTDGTAGTSCDINVSGCFHGNHVSGIAAGGPATVGTTPPSDIMGIASGSDLVGMNVFSTFFSMDICGGPDPCIRAFTDDQMNALEWIADNYTAYNICSANMSLGGGQSMTHCDSEPLFPIITMLRGLGVVTVIASGNNGFDDSVSFPACISTAVAVGSVSSTDQISGFSNHGPGTLVDLLAPGESILSAYGISGGSIFYAFATGTSMATPHVAAAFALLKSGFPDASVDEIEEALKQTGVTVTDDVTGLTGPRIQIDEAIKFLTPPDAIPTMGEWGLISLCLLLLIFGVVRIKAQEQTLATSRVKK